MISHEKKFIFTHINKAGGTSVRHMLKKFDKNTVGHHIDGRRKHTFLYLPMELPKGSKNYLPPILAQSDNKFDDYFKFTFVRNPWSRMVSFYFHMLKRKWKGGGDKSALAESKSVQKISFRDWILGTKEYSFKSTILIYPQLDWVTDQNQKIGVNFIGQLETFEKDFFYVCDKIGMERPKKLAHKKKRRVYRGRPTMSRPYREYYDKETQSAVADVYQKDIKYFGYEFGS